MKTMIQKMITAGLSVMLLCVLFAADTSASPKTRSMKLSKKKITMEVGRSIKLKSKGKAAIKVKISPKRSNLAIKVKSSNRDIIKVKRLGKYSYKLTALKEGRATITVTSLGNKKIKRRFKITVKAGTEERTEDKAEDKTEKKPDENTEKKSDDKAEKLPDLVMTALQTAQNKVMVYFNRELPDGVTMASFMMKNKTGNTNVLLKNIIVSTDKKTAEIETAEKMVTGDKNEIAYTDTADGKTFTFEFLVENKDTAGTEVTLLDHSFCTTKKPLNWGSPDNAKEKVIPEDATDVTIEVKVKTGDGKIFSSDTDSSKFVFKSTNDGVFSMSEKKIIPKAIGTAEIVAEVTLEGKKTELTVSKVKIGEKPEPKKIVFNMAGTIMFGIKESEDVKILAVKDQYENDVDMAGDTFKASVRSFEVNKTGPEVSVLSNHNVKIVRTDRTDLGTYTIEITFAKDGKEVKGEFSLEINELKKSKDPIEIVDPKKPFFPFFP